VSDGLHLRQVGTPVRAAGFFSDLGAVPPEGFIVSGDASLLESDGFAVLTSRKPRFLYPDTPWLRAVFDFFTDTGERGGTYFGSIGEAIHEAPAWAAGESGGKVAAILPDYISGNSGGKAVERAFEAGAARLLDILGAGTLPEKTAIAAPVWPAGAPAPKDKRGKLHLRDMTVAALAARMYTVDVSPDGSMQRVAAAARSAGRKIFPFASRPGTEEKGASYRWPAVIAESCTKFFERNAVISHYVRACPGPWPGQSRSEYYRALFRREPLAAHSAFDTLRRIAATGVIHASSRWVRGRREAASFTGAPPQEIARLHRYVKHLGRWDFEPFAVCIEMRTALALGAVEVAYLNAADDWRVIPEDRLWRYQPRFRGGADASGEAEWRIPGDVRIGELPCDSVRLLAPGRAEADILQGECRYAVMALDGG